MEIPPQILTPMKTPRTDKAEFEVFDGQNLAAVVESEFARQLEAKLETAVRLLTLCQEQPIGSEIDGMIEQLKETL